MKVIYVIYILVSISCFIMSISMFYDLVIRDIKDSIKIKLEPYKVDRENEKMIREAAEFIPYHLRGNKDD